MTQEVWRRGLNVSRRANDSITRTREKMREDESIVKLPRGGGWSWDASGSGRKVADAVGCFWYLADLVRYAMPEYRF